MAFIYIKRIYCHAGRSSSLTLIGTSRICIKKIYSFDERSIEKVISKTLLFRLIFNFLN